MVTRSTAGPEIALSPALEDYVEAIYTLESEGRDGVRVTDIAAQLGTRLPTVVRSVARLRQLGLADQPERGPVSLTAEGEALARQLAHRHADVVRWLVDILGVEPMRAEADACVLEHGLSAESAQRLHEFLEHWDAQPRRQQHMAHGGRAHRQRKRNTAPDFDLIGTAAGSGSRG
jgi:DtxR family Mn-dependent transcriptional regulator